MNKPVDTKLQIMIPGKAAASDAKQRRGHAELMIEKTRRELADRRQDGDKCTTDLLHEK
jgi:hypothetical protein